MSAADRVVFGDTTIDYVIRKTNRSKTIAITVHPNMAVSVAAPKGTRRSIIANRIRSKAEWIIQQQERLRRNKSHLAKDFVSGETFRYLGRQYPLKVQRSATIPAAARVSMNRGSLVVTVGRHWSVARRRQSVQQALVTWYRERALQQINAAAGLLAKQVRVDVKAIEIREMKTRWGSGGADGRLRFNWRIVMAPKRLLEYVVAHEICHLKHRNHSREFWRLLGRIMPDCQQRRQDLERIGMTLQIQ
jgi:predicted metal-dependent hydrolase